MSLLEQAARNCVLMEKTRKPDGSGGYIVVWEEGAPFVVYAALNTSVEARVAEKGEMSRIYSAMVERSFPIEYGDYYKDVETEGVYRVTSDPKDKEARKSSTLKLKYFTAERTELTS